MPQGQVAEGGSAGDQPQRDPEDVRMFFRLPRHLPSATVIAFCDALEVADLGGPEMVDFFGNGREPALRRLADDRGTGAAVGPEFVEDRLRVPHRSEERRVGKECRSRW